MRGGAGAVGGAVGAVSVATLPVVPRAGAPYTRGRTLPVRHPMSNRQTVLTIDGMTCGHCVKAVEKALAALPGVKSVAVDLAKGSATIAHADGVLDAIKKVVTDEGYEVIGAVTK